MGSEGPALSIRGLRACEVSETLRGHTGERPVSGVKLVAALHALLSAVIAKSPQEPKIARFHFQHAHPRARTRCMRTARVAVPCHTARTQSIL